jgi:hypothetical protein
MRTVSVFFSFIMKVSSIIKERDDESSPDERERETVLTVLPFLSRGAEALGQRSSFS